MSVAPKTSTLPDLAQQKQNTQTQNKESSGGIFGSFQRQSPQPQQQDDEDDIESLPSFLRRGKRQE